jgi:cytochrome c oxidase assembly protein subunit 15
MGLALLALWQLVSGLSNVVLGWPLAAALAHSGGSALLALVLASLLAQVHLRGGSAAPAQGV